MRTGVPSAEAQVLLGRARVHVGRLRGLRLRRPRERALDERLGLAHRQAAGDDLARGAR